MAHMNTETSLTEWFISPKKLQDPTLRLFVFPYAGAVPSAFWSWAEYLPESIELILIKLPGRGTRIKEPPIDDLSYLIDRILHAMTVCYMDKPFAFYGHSLGALEAFEAARMMQKRGHPPVHLFVSGKTPPHIPNSNPILYSLSDTEFIEALHRLGGMFPSKSGLPSESFDFPEIIDLSLPSLRADIKMFENYEYYSDSPLECPITAYGGDGDPLVPVACIKEWEYYTGNRFSYSIFHGSHFFINDDKWFLNTIRRELGRYVSP